MSKGILDKDISKKKGMNRVTLGYALKLTKSEKFNIWFSNDIHLLTQKWARESLSIPIQNCSNLASKHSSGASLPHLTIRIQRNKCKGEDGFRRTNRDGHGDQEFLLLGGRRHLVVREVQIKCKNKLGMCISAFSDSSFQLVNTYR